jgi:hypothetical protein
MRHLACPRAWGHVDVVVAVLSRLEQVGRRGWPGRGRGDLRHDLRNSTRTGTIASGAGWWPCPGRVRRLALGSAATTASAASGRPGKVWSPEYTIVGTVTVAQRPGLGRQADHRGQVVAHRLVVLGVGQQRAQRGEVGGEAAVGEERRLIQGQRGDPTPALAAARAMLAPEELVHSAAVPPTALISAATSSTSRSSAHGWVSPDRPRPRRS